MNKDTDKLIQCSRDHVYAPGALDIAVWSFNSMTPREQTRALHIYNTLIAEKRLPRKWVRK